MKALILNILIILIGCLAIYFIIKIAAHLMDEIPNTRRKYSIAAFISVLGLICLTVVKRLLF